MTCAPRACRRDRRAQLTVLTPPLTGPTPAPRLPGEFFDSVRRGADRTMPFRGDARGGHVVQRVSSLRAGVLACCVPACLRACAGVPACWCAGPGGLRACVLADRPTDRPVGDAR